LFDTRKMTRPLRKPTGVESDRYLFYDRLECGVCRDELLPEGWWEKRNRAQAAVGTARPEAPAPDLAASSPTRTPTTLTTVSTATVAPVMRSNQNLEAGVGLVATNLSQGLPSSSAFPVAGLFKRIKFSRKRAGCCVVQKKCAQKGAMIPCPAEPVLVYTLLNLQQCMNKCHMAQGCTAVEFTARPAKSETGSCEVIFSPVRRARQGSCSCYGYSPNVNLFD